MNKDEGLPLISLLREADELRRKATCGPLFEKVLEVGREESLKHPDPALFMFSLGHLAGQAEKVYLGACPAFMVRASHDETVELTKRAVMVCHVYKLEPQIVETRRGIEVWITRPGARSLITVMSEAEEGSPKSHLFRGVLCGVPMEEIDLKFHERRERSSQAEKNE